MNAMSATYYLLNSGKYVISLISIYFVQRSYLVNFPLYYIFDEVGFGERFQHILFSKIRAKKKIPISFTQEIVHKTHLGAPLAL